MHEPQPAQPLLQATALTRRFGGLTAVDAVSLDLHVGQVHAVIGTNGAGKSTLINMLSGEIPPSDGSIAFEGADISRWSQPRRARAGVGRSYQRTTIFHTFDVLENCRLAAQASVQRPWALWQAASACAASLDRAHGAMEAAGLAQMAHIPAGSLSHGQQRQLEIAMCLATAPRVLLLDEPLAGMGAEETERMLAMLEQLKQAHAVLLVEHDMDAVFRIADHITVMVNGQVIASAAPDAIRNNPDVQLAYLGDAHVH
ncbi:ABC transporter ATP-binding protein [Undibacterium sp.]|uniref:ABC transporter ATP-binding protein n=1 Tax=Undibacterium sp. TaxID=1914977 RepID=UPI00374DD7E8